MCERPQSVCSSGFDTLDAQSHAQPPSVSRPFWSYDRAALEPTTDPSDLLSLSEAARKLDLRDERTVRRQLERHAIPLVRLGRRVRVERRALEVLVERSRAPIAPRTIRKAKNLRAHAQRAQGAPMARKRKTGATAGGRQWVEKGLWRWHEKGCNASLERGISSRCECRFYCQQPDEMGVWRLRPMEARSLKAARREKKQLQSAEPTVLIDALRPDLTTDEYVTEVFLKECDLSESTKRNYESRWSNDLQPLLGHMRMVDVTRRHIDAVLKKLKEKADARRAKMNQPTPSFVENRLTALRSVFGYAHATGYIRINPVAKRKLRKDETRRPGERHANSRRRILTEEQVRLLVQHAQRAVAAGGLAAREAMVSLFGLFLGLRISEAVAVIWSDIDFEQRTIQISRQWSVEEKKLIPLKGTKAERHLPIPRTLFALLRLLRSEEEARATFDPDDFVVYRDDPRHVMPQQRARKAFARMQTELGITCEDGFRLVFHGLRHTCATLAIRRGRPLIKVSEFLGHESVKVTQQVYVHLLSGDLAEVADALDDVAGDAPIEARPEVESVDEFIDDVLGTDTSAA